MSMKMRYLWTLRAYRRKHLLQIPSPAFFLKPLQSLDLKNHLNSFSCCKTPQSLNPWSEASFPIENPSVSGLKAFFLTVTPFNFLKPKPPSYCKPFTLWTQTHWLQTPLIFGPRLDFLLQTFKYQGPNSVYYCKHFTIRISNPLSYCKPL